MKLIFANQHVEQLIFNEVSYSEFLCFEKYNYFELN